MEFDGRNPAKQVTWRTFSHFGLQFLIDARWSRISSNGLYNLMFCSLKRRVFFSRGRFLGTGGFCPTVGKDKQMIGGGGFPTKMEDQEHPVLQEIIPAFFNSQLMLCLSRLSLSKLPLRLAFRSAIHRHGAMVAQVPDGASKSRTTA